MARLESEATPVYKPPAKKKPEEDNFTALARLNLMKSDTPTTPVFTPQPIQQPVQQVQPAFMPSMRGPGTYPTPPKYQQPAAQVQTPSMQGPGAQVTQLAGQIAATAPVSPVVAPAPIAKPATPTTPAASANGFDWDEGRRMRQSAFKNANPNAAKLKDAEEKDYTGGQFWHGTDTGDNAEFKAWRERNPTGQGPTSQELREVQKWENNNYDARHVPPRMSPYMAGFANISEAERRKYYMTDYPYLRLKEQPAGTDTSGGGYGYGGGGGGGWGGYSQRPPAWFERMLNWRI